MKVCERQKVRAMSICGKISESEKAICVILVTEKCNFAMKYTYLNAKRI